ncbi:MAG: hypothetical protein ACI9U1_000701 [Porticoccaceae bacterium]|jgi:uncharacterized protein YcsI (UPF0317 family)
MQNLEERDVENSTACRRLVRQAKWKEPTAGMAPGFIQGNVVILPEAYAADFMQYCLNNPKPCPLLGISKAGSRSLKSLGEDIDLARDIPKYHIYHNAGLVKEAIDIVDLWREDLVTFVLGCSFSFEHALQLAGHPVRHIDLKQNVPMFDTNISTVPGGIFSGQLVVTMRPVKRESLREVYRICSRYTFAHGAPIHAGDPSIIGISNLDNPQYGDPVELEDDEVPVFWACGVTTQVALMNGRPDFYVTHAPGYMLITDLVQPDDIDPIKISTEFYKELTLEN